MEGMESFAGKELVSLEQIPTEGLVLVKLDCGNMRRSHSDQLIAGVRKSIQAAKDSGATTAAFIVAPLDHVGQVSFETLTDEALAKLGLQRIKPVEVQS